MVGTLQLNTQLPSLRIHVLNKPCIHVQEFPSANDTCYLAHSYPYTFSDLCSDLDTLMADPSRSRHIKKEVLCETKAGNSCFLLTITNTSRLSGSESITGDW